MPAIITDDEDSDFQFTYDTDLENAVAPQLLPERAYIATVTEAKKTKSKSSGKDQIVIKHNIAPEDYPIDYPVDHAPDGVDITYYSPDVGNNIHGRHQMKLLCQAYGVPLTSRVDINDFVGKRIKIDVIKRDNDMGSSLWLKGLPKLVS